MGKNGSMEHYGLITPSLESIDLLHPSALNNRNQHIRGPVSYKNMQYFTG